MTGLDYLVCKTCNIERPATFNAGVMDVDFDFSDVDSFFNEGEWEVEKKIIDVGDEAVKYAEEHGNLSKDPHRSTLRTVQ